MEALCIYLGKMILTSGLMFGYYKLLLKDKTFHHYNRFYLLGTLLVSLLLPLLKVSYFTIDTNSDIYLLINKLQPVSAAVNNDALSVPGIFALAFALISVLLTARFVYGIFKMVHLKSRFPREKFAGLNFYQTDLADAPFSYFRNLFWKNNIPLHSDLGKQILKHEMAHIEQKHTYDKILMETLRAVFWFNPFFHLIRKEVYLIHEYLADHKAVKKSDTKAFAQMLLASHFSGNTLPAASPLLNTHLKKRLQMIQASKTKFSYARKMLALPLLFSITFACMVQAQNREINVTNKKIAQAVNKIGKTTSNTGTGITVSTDEGKVRTKEQEQSASVLQQSEAEISDLEQQIREVAQALEALDPGTDEASEKFNKIASLSEKISTIVNSTHFKREVTVVRNKVVHYTNVLSKEELEEITAEAARAKEAGAAALEEAKIAIKEAAVAREEAIVMQKEADEAKVAADMARKEAALAREQTARMK
ncbi:MAG: M56 family metallopeptidase [Sphingobacteriales bacterium]|nr:MAG: M56 family metallopeptidase [Sphingobacteriales bacterium]